MRINEELFERKVVAVVYKTEINDRGDENVECVGRCNYLG
jgi:hypothetical protein